MRATYFFVLYIIVLSFVSYLHAGNVKISDQASEDPLDQLLGNSHFRKFMPNSAYFGADKMTILNKKSNASDDLIPVVLSHHYWAQNCKQNSSTVTHIGTAIKIPIGSRCLLPT
jgi:hypothetical protein